MTIPADDIPVPPAVRALAGDDLLTPVWRNGIGAVTFRAISATGEVRYIKWGPLDPESSASDQAERLAWAGKYLVVPRVLDHGGDDRHEWIITRGIAGESAVTPRWTAEPDVAVRAIGRGLRMFHDALPVDDCPWTWDVPDRLAAAAARGIDIPPSFRAFPEIDRLVVCHGDACAPNTLLGEDGGIVGHVDLGALGVADRWADLAVASMSTEWNYGPGWEDILIRAYGLEPDRERLNYYRDLWNAE